MMRLKTFRRTDFPVEFPSTLPWQLIRKADVMYNVYTQIGLPGHITTVAHYKKGNYIKLIKY